jgi:hypothetical protein
VCLLWLWCCMTRLVAGLLALPGRVIWGQASQVRVASSLWCNGLCCMYRGGLKCLYMGLVAVVFVQAVKGSLHCRCAAHGSVVFFFVGVRWHDGRVCRWGMHPITLWCHSRPGKALCLLWLCAGCGRVTWHCFCYVAGVLLVGVVCGWARQAVTQAVQLHAQPCFRGPSGRHTETFAH